ncbi:MAG TPA: A/G-specific adenine glycosylase [Methanomicrobia archaeon]|nr:A/G-specific adenine glycosylase [Methanomicrobia archaeon]
MNADEIGEAERSFRDSFRESMQLRKLTSEAITAFQALIYAYFREHGRKLPWRETNDPYHILVSEIMLQQTQVERVIEKYEAFINAFPDFHALVQAPLQEILQVWQGLGYNRRAIALKRTAETVVTVYAGALPSEPTELVKLPGIGPYTAAAILTFAFSQPQVFIETNIRTVFIHFFFAEQSEIADAEIRPLVKQTLDAEEPRRWYYALMDYGVLLKQQYQNPGRRSAHYQKQTPFKGSNRELRGALLRALTRESRVSERELIQVVGADPERMEHALGQLQNEGLVKKSGSYFHIA